MSASRKETLEIREILLEDIPHVAELLKNYISDGEHTLRLLFQNCDNHLWQVAVNERGEIVGNYRGILFKFPETVEIFIGNRHFIREDYRSQGVAVRFREAIGNRGVIANATNDALAKLSWFKKFTTKFLRYQGNPNQDCLRNLGYEPPTDFTVGLLENEADMKLVLAYDRVVFDYDRRKFTRAWSSNSGPNEPYARTVIVKRKSNGACLGYGTIRENAGKYKMAPVYADEPKVAKAILYELTRLYVTECGGKPFEVIFNAKNRTMIEFARQCGLQFSTTTTKAYTRGADGKARPEILEKYIRWDLVYSQNDLAAV